MNKIMLKIENVPTMAILNDFYKNRVNVPKSKKRHLGAILGAFLNKIIRKGK